ncbi:MAG: leucine-rich repeat protein [Lachnospiraceae bacterium]|nr:leucine-rich repeat protein [Lachnospiraceae bacterium]
MKRVSKCIVFLALMLFLISIEKPGITQGSETNNTDSAVIFEYNGSTYEIISEKKHYVELVKSRPLKDYNGKCYKQERYVYKDNVKYAVTSIGYKAFSKDGLDAAVKIDVKLPKSVKVLKTECMGVNIRKLNLKSTVIKTIPSYLFVTYDGKKDVTPAISKVILPKNCKKIAGYAFNKCANLKSLTLPAAVKKIGYYAIDKTCTKLTIEAGLPEGILNQTMKNTVIYVKPEYYIDALEVLIKQVSTGKCEVRETGDQINE